jgi:hypothetical protein
MSHLYRQVYHCTAGNALWIVPGSHTQGRLDVCAMAAAPAADGSDRLPHAVPILCAPGDVYLQNRMSLHCAFANESDTPRMTLQWVRACDPPGAPVPMHACMYVCMCRHLPPLAGWHVMVTHGFNADPLPGVCVCLPGRPCGHRASTAVPP